MGTGMSICSACHRSRLIAYAIFGGAFGSVGNSYWCAPAVNTGQAKLRISIVAKRTFRIPVGFVFENSLYKLFTRRTCVIIAYMFIFDGDIIAAN